MRGQLQILDEVLAFDDPAAGPGWPVAPQPAIPQEPADVRLAVADSAGDLVYAEQIGLFAFFAALAETERDNIREGTLEGLDAAARQGKHGGRPPVITDDMLHTVLRRRAAGETVEQIQPDLVIPTGKRKGRNPSVASIYRALAAYEKARAYRDAVEQAHAAHKQRADDLPAIVRPRPARVLDPIDPELAARVQGRPLNRLE